MKNILLAVVVAANFAPLVSYAGETEAPFTDSERAFKITMQKLLERFEGKAVTRDDLYRAATAGMLASLNPDPENKERQWNALLTPEDIREMKVEMTGKVAGIGASIAFDKEHGYGDVVHVIAGSPAEKYGLKTGDQILSVEGERFKDKTLRDLVMRIRGEAGSKVNLRVLRDDRVVDLAITRGTVPWVRVALQEIDPSTGLLYIDNFTTETVKNVEKYLRDVNAKHYKKLIVDVRDNTGGGFEEAVKTAGFFLPKGAVIATTRDRNGGRKEIVSEGAVLDPNVELVVLTNKNTHCGAELLTEALKENRGARIVGQTTSGKWNIQSVEMLSNDYAIKYTVSEFYSPQGNTFQDRGIKPDVEVSFDKDPARDGLRDLNELREKFALEKRLVSDPQLKAAVELARYRY